MKKVAEFTGRYEGCPSAICPHIIVYSDPVDGRFTLSVSTFGGSSQVNLDADQVRGLVRREDG